MIWKDSFLCFFSCAFCHQFGSLRHGNIDIYLFACFFKREICTSACPVCGRWWGRQCRWLDSVRCYAAMTSWAAFWANSNLHRKQQPMDQGFLCILGYSMCLGWNLRLLRKWLNSASIFFPVHRYTVRLQKQMCDHWICRETFKLTYPNLQSHESAQHSTVLYTKARQVAFHSKRWMHSLSMQSGCYTVFAVVQNERASPLKCLSWAVKV